MGGAVDHQENINLKKIGKSWGIILNHLTVTILMIFLFKALAHGVGLEIVPGALKVILQPKAAKSVEVEVTNHALSAITYDVEPEYWSPATAAQPINEWIKVTPKQMVLSPGQKKIIKLTIARPEHLDGEVVAMVYLAAKPNPGMLSIQTRIGFPVYVRTSKVKKMAEIKNFRMSRDDVRLKFTFVVVNEGDSHLLPFGAIVLTRQGKIIAQKEVTFNRPLFPKRSVVKTIGLNKSVFRPGRYQAQLRLFLDDLYAEQTAEPKLPMISSVCRADISGN